MTVLPCLWTQLQISNYCIKQFNSCTILPLLTFCRCGRERKVWGLLSRAYDKLNNGNGKTLWTRLPPVSVSSLISMWLFCGSLIVLSCNSCSSRTCRLHVPFTDMHYLLVMHGQRGPCTMKHARLFQTSRQAHCREVNTCSQLISSRTMLGHTRSQTYKNTMQMSSMLHTE